MDNTPDTSALEASQQRQMAELKQKEDDERKKAEEQRISAMRSKFGGGVTDSGITKPSSSLLGG